MDTEEGEPAGRARSGRQRRLLISERDHGEQVAELALLNQADPIYRLKARLFGKGFERF